MGVIGTLLGYVTEGKPIVEITDAFPVVHQDTEDRGVLMDQDYHRQMLALRQKVSPKEGVVGWFGTGDEITESSVVVHAFYQNQKDCISRRARCCPPRCTCWLTPRCPSKHTWI